MRENHARHMEAPPQRNAANTATTSSAASTAERRRTEPVSDGKDNKSPSEPQQATASEMNTLGWSFRTQTTRIGFAMFDVDAIAESSFDDRFAAAFEVSSVSQPSVIQRMMDPVGAIP
jgi:hypothetical protein